jgi:hypothetical protein
VERATVVGCSTRRRGQIAPIPAIDASADRGHPRQWSERPSSAAHQAARAECPHPGDRRICGMITRAMRGQHGPGRRIRPGGATPAALCAGNTALVANRVRAGQRPRAIRRYSWPRPPPVGRRVDRFSAVVTRYRADRTCRPRSVRLRAIRRRAGPGSCAASSATYFVSPVPTIRSGPGGAARRPRRAVRNHAGSAVRRHAARPAPSDRGRGSAARHLPARPHRRGSGRG